MREKDLGISEYLDIYGNILDEKQLQIIDMYYNEDYSLSEISEICSISRQGVGESIKKSVKRLKLIESQLHLLEKRNTSKACRCELILLINELCDVDKSAQEELMARIIAGIDELII